MIDDSQLLELAKELSIKRTRGAPRKVHLRRAISSAYYALFHCLANRATCDLIGLGVDKSPRFRLIYRSFQHADMLAACKQAIKPLPTEFGFRNFGPELQLCAHNFIALQKLRHDADYNPHAQFTLSDTQAAITRAEIAMRTITEAPVDERRLFLLTLHYKHRP
jgi:uncharacterized protein (UPF0332 family)